MTLKGTTKTRNSKKYNTVTKNKKSERTERINKILHRKSKTKQHKSKTDRRCLVLGMANI